MSLSRDNTLDLIKKLLNNFGKSDSRNFHPFQESKSKATIKGAHTVTIDLEESRSSLALSFAVMSRMVPKEMVPGIQLTVTHQ